MDRPGISANNCPTVGTKNRQGIRVHKGRVSE